MKKGTITLKQLQKLYKAVAHTPAPTKLKDKELISFLKKN